jgi:hypothetical protein
MHSITQAELRMSQIAKRAKCEGVLDGRITLEEPHDPA